MEEEPVLLYIPMSAMTELLADFLSVRGFRFVSAWTEEFGEEVEIWERARQR